MSGETSHTLGLRSPWADPFVRLCGLLTLIGMAGFLVWAALIPLDEGVSAGGTIVVENSRQVVQHLEGGIIADLRVSEGDMVEAGEPLVVLQSTATQAGRDQVLLAVAGLRVAEQRILALRSGTAPVFDVLDDLPLDETRKRDIIERQSRLYDQQLRSHEADLTVLEARQEGARTTARLNGEQITITERALAATRGQLDSTRAMFAQQMVRLDQVQALERDVAGLEADIVRLRTDRASALSAAEDLAGQIAQANALFDRAIAEELVDVRSRLASGEEELLAAQDMLDRTVLFAPQAGEVLNLRFSTEGGVVRPGEPIMEIVPTATGVVASVRIRPVDRARIFIGQAVRAQIQAYEGWGAPRLAGEVIAVSADLKTDPVTGVEYYEIRIRIPEEEVAAAGGLALLPGMPMTAFVFSGARRTTLEYLFEPILGSMERGLGAS